VAGTTTPARSGGWGTQVSLLDRVRQTRRLVRSEGLPGVSLRVRRRLADRLLPAGSQPLPLADESFDGACRAETSGWTYPGPLKQPPGAPLTVAWVCAPPGPGSGGHTTMFRLVAALERAGHRCVIYLHDRHGWELERHTATIRSHWPAVRAEVADLAGGIEDCDAVVATGWETAYAVLGSTARGVRTYLVQDFEPLFSAAGSEYLLAEATYGFGFHGITAGRWLAERLSRDYGMTAEAFDLACDLDAYRLPAASTTVASATGAFAAPEQAPRNAVAYYCRPHTPRRAHELAMLGLERFARLRPETPIHTYGSVLQSLPFPATQHGVLSPVELGALYRRCVAGLSLSATNVSLVPLEMLAAGCVPVVNDAVQNRLVLDNDHVRYVSPLPWDIAHALAGLVDQGRAEVAATAAAAARSVDGRTWDRVEDEVVTIFERLVAAART